MADINGGRVLAGEDSEEDDEDEEEMSFQFNGFGSQSTSAPRFTVPTVVAPSVGTEGEEDEESDGDSEDATLKAVDISKEEKSEEQDKTLDSDEQGKNEGVNSSEAKQTTEKAVEKTGEAPVLWEVDGSINGIELMSNAFVESVQPSLDSTIHRIAELKESQRRLLKMLMEQNAGIKSNKQLEDAAVVLEKLPFYAKKLQGIKLAMQEISTSTEKMKRRADSLRVDAQSHAIKKENKRDVQSQWNKLYAAKNAPDSGASSSQS
ncbi:Snapin/Pallidin [Phytophthora infestans]|uniref:Snapin/Pallidin n=1 Tax=Phytophthora infestans TaxID=4787 RepID=A0A8S9U5K1_PHYIN|nr:Snapin/Pallidin [Phytophthora infestans]